VQKQGLFRIFLKNLSRRQAIRWLEIVLFIVFIYSLILVFAGSLASELFSLFGFGPSELISTQEFQEYLLLPYMVLGAVMAGWTLLLLQIVRGPLKDGVDWARTFIIRSLMIWFFLDTGMSLVLGYPNHALFNIPFAVALGIPLYLLSKK
jgi:hypothetical protein